VTLTATPADGWVFCGWSGDATDSTDTITITMNADRSVTAKFMCVAGFRTIRVGNYTGSMTLVPKGGNYVGVLRDSSSGFGFDLDGQMVADKLTINMRLLNTSIAPSLIDCTMTSNGTFSGTYTEPGYSPEGFNADAATATDFSNDLMGYWRATVDGNDARLAICQHADGKVRGTALIPVDYWDGAQWWLLPIGLDITGTVSGTRMSLTLSAGSYNFTVTTEVANDTRWTGQINGGGYTNAPFVAER
jgi:uncharacterized repeat protein (TIGR02543 family)